MTTLAANSPRVFEPEGTDIGDYPVIASDIIYEGAAVGDNASGYARPLVAGDPFRGFAESKADNASGAAGAINVRVRTHGVVKLSISALAITDVGKDVFASDDDTFTLTQGSNTRIGSVLRWVSTGVGMIQFRATDGQQTELTDNSGGTANTTLTALGGLTTLTDNTGGSGTHDDTVADGLTTVAATAQTSATVTGTLTGTVDGAMEDVADIALSTSDVYTDAAVNTAVNTAIAAVNLQLKELQTALNEAVADLTSLYVFVGTVLTDLTVQNQNDSDVAQKVIELVADMDDAKNNFADLAAAVNSVIRRLGN